MQYDIAEQSCSIKLCFQCRHIIDVLSVSVEKLNWKLIKLWLPVNVIFVGMLVSGMYRLLKGLESRYKSMAIQFQHLEECFQLYNGFSSILYLRISSCTYSLLFVICREMRDVRMQLL